MSERSDSMEGFNDLSTDEQRAQLHAIFAKCDKDHEARIALSEFVDLWAALQLPEEDDENPGRLGALFRQMDANGDGVITFDEVSKGPFHRSFVGLIRFKQCQSLSTTCKPSSTPSVWRLTRMMAHPMAMSMKTKVVLPTCLSGD